MRIISHVLACFEMASRSHSVVLCHFYSWNKEREYKVLKFNYYLLFCVIIHIHMYIMLLNERWKVRFEFQIILILRECEQFDCGLSNVRF